MILFGFGQKWDLCLSLPWLDRNKLTYHSTRECKTSFCEAADASCKHPFCLSVQPRCCAPLGPPFGSSGHPWEPSPAPVPCTSELQSQAWFLAHCKHCCSLAALPYCGFWVKFGLINCCKASQLHTPLSQNILNLLFCVVIRMLQKLCLWGEREALTLEAGISFKNRGSEIPAFPKSHLVKLLPLP